MTSILIIDKPAAPMNKPTRQVAKMRALEDFIFSAVGEKCSVFKGQIHEQLFVDSLVTSIAMVAVE